MTVATWLDSLEDVEPVDPAELAQLRAELEDEARREMDAVAGRIDPDLWPIRLPKQRLADLERCPRSALARFRATTDAPPGAAVLRGTALDQFVAHQLVVGRVREPLADLSSMLRAAADDVSLQLLDELGEQRSRELVEPLAGAVAESWGGIDPRWVPQVQSRAALVLADGACVCSGVVDVEFGGRGTGRPGVVIEVKSGAAAAAHVHEIYLYALLVALRDREAPAVVARWYPGADPSGPKVTLGVLEAAAARLVAGLRTWTELLAGGPAPERAGGWCSWCPDEAVCPSARLARSGADSDPGSFEGGLDDGAADPGW